MKEEFKFDFNSKLDAPKFVAEYLSKYVLIYLIGLVLITASSVIISVQFIEGTIRTIVVAVTLSVIPAYFMYMSLLSKQQEALELYSYIVNHKDAIDKQFQQLKDCGLFGDEDSDDSNNDNM